jgi:hypothetical protein
MVGSTLCKTSESVWGPNIFTSPIISQECTTYLNIPQTETPTQVCPCLSQETPSDAVPLHERFVGRCQASTNIPENSSVNTSIKVWNFLQFISTPQLGFKIKSDVAACRAGIAGRPDRLPTQQEHCHTHFQGLSPWPKRVIHSFYPRACQVIDNIHILTYCSLSVPSS